MTQHPATLDEAFAGLRHALVAARENCVRMPVMMEAMLLVLLLRLLGQLERLARAWRAGRLDHRGLSRSQARIADGLVPPRAEREPPLADWLVGLYPNCGMRPARRPRQAPRAGRPLRTPPPEPARAGPPAPRAAP